EPNHPSQRIPGWSGSPLATHGQSWRTPPAPYGPTGVHQSSFFSQQDKPIPSTSALSCCPGCRLYSLALAPALAPCLLLPQVAVVCGLWSSLLVLSIAAAERDPIWPISGLVEGYGTCCSNFAPLSAFLFANSPSILKPALSNISDSPLSILFTHPQPPRLHTTLTCVRPW
ncbi:hypothetical protein F4679DRAFT_436789, partial [Xylaria curta]